MEEKQINFKAIEKKWQEKWEKAKIFEVKEESKKPKFYVLEMFPYPSGEGLHMGHALNYSIGDVLARFKRMKGFNVLYPMGYDSLGLPAENAAIKAGKHPQDYTDKAIKNYIRQQKELGLSYDWTRVINTASPDYYKWDQWIFLKMFEKNLAYQKTAAVNFCSKCQTVLANEQVQNGKCWRHEDTDVEIKHLKQWFLKTTNYADELYENTDKLDWPEKTKAMQKNWIGKSHGTEIDFEINNSDKKISNVIIVHGCPSKEEDLIDITKMNAKHWIPWVKQKLIEKGIEVYTPLMPTPWKRDYEKWKIEFEKLKINENSILIGHSCGTAFLVRWLGETKRKINKLILVAPWKNPDKNDKIKNKFYDFEIDSSIKERVNEIIMFTSNNEEQDGKNALKLYYDLLGGKIIDLKDKGHYTYDDMNGQEFPELLNEISQTWKIFTTRPDTIFGVTFMVVSAQHEKLQELITKEQKKNVEEFLKKIKTTSQKSMKDVEELNKEGVFTGSYAINPATCEKVPVYAGNFVIADYGSGMVMAVPAHDQRDFEFAKKYKIPVKQVIAPYFETTQGLDAVRADKKTVERNAIFAIIKHWKEDKYFCLDWEKFGWKTLLIGGVEKGETPEQAVEREVKEESGYQDIKSIKKIGFETHANFFARHKDVNRYGRFNTYLVELKSDKYIEPKEEDIKNHKGQWLDKNQVANFITLDNHQYSWNIYSNQERAHTDTGILINSQEFNSTNNKQAIEQITSWLNKKGKARKVVNFKLRDWLVSRQRYWGTPIPVIYCEKCGVVPVPEKDLPVKLPKDVKFGKGNPLLTAEDWVNVKCPKCNGKAKRETDTMDTFVNSSWYYLRYCDPKNNKKIFDLKKAKYWCPIDQYIGGAEHACLHLIYTRFYTKFLADLKLINFREPAKKLFHQGMLAGEGGVKMSKSKGNVINPDAVSEKYGIDTARYFLLSLASPDKPRDWSEAGIQGSLRFIKRIFNVFENVRKEFSERPKIPKQNTQRFFDIKQGKDSEETEILINKTIKDIEQEYSSFDYRTATIKLKELFEFLEKQEQVSKPTLEKSLILLHPICPHISEELWEKLGNKSFISLEKWPKADESKLKQKQERLDINEKIINYSQEIIKKLEEKKKVKKIYLYVLPFEIKQINKEKISGKLGKQVEIFAVNDSKKFDPENKSKKAQPGRPGIYLE